MVGDAVILIENGVYAFAEYFVTEGSISQYSASVFAVEADVLARGVPPGDAIKLIDYTGFVQLCTEYDKVVTW